MTFPGHNDCICAECETKAELLKREELVQEVIRCTRDVAVFDDEGGNLNAFDAAQDALERACRKLAEWKP